ncbi:MAG: CBS domain-containing protein [Chloroflexota bacterium]|nr:CBS domain-containing protein [Chloroflexota bacterium]
MLYASQLQGKQIWDAWSLPVGECVDVLVGALDRPYPPLRALAVRNGESDVYFIPAEQISSLFPSINLKVPQTEIKSYEPRGDELWLIDQVLDRQIVDTEGRRVVRVNDLQIMRIRDQFCLTGVDVGAQGLVRRLGLGKPVQAVANALGRSLPSGVIPWEDVAPLQPDEPLRLQVSRDKITRLPPADIASILNDLDRRTSEALATAFSDETLADTLEESPSDVQVAVLSRLSPGRAADILEEMGPDEAADLLADLSREASTELLALMEDEEAEEVQTLLRHPVDSAGGIMTTEFARVPDHLTIGQTLDYLRRSPEANEDEVMHYVYLIDQQGRLQGVISLRDLVMAPRDDPLSAWSDDDPVTVGPHTSQEDVAYLVAKYDLLAVPVVDEESGELLGIVTVDDAIDAVLPTAWKKRIPRFF